MKGGQLILSIDTQAGSPAAIAGTLHAIAEEIERGSINFGERMQTKLWVPQDHGNGRLGTIFVEPVDKSS
jgi:hypothetical protein